jgi:hypothetical protein
MGQNGGEYYHKNQYNFGNMEYIDFIIYGSIEKKALNNIEYYYVLKFYEPIIFTKGFEHDETIVSVILEEIQLIFINDELKMRVDFDWGGHVLNGRIRFPNDSNYYTPVIMYVEKIEING